MFNLFKGCGKRDFMPENDEREQQLLDAASAVIIRQGYDKTTMSDIAAEAGASRGTVYLYFKSKEAVFEALALREWVLYARAWLENIEADPRGGTLGGFYRAVFRAINSRPLMTSLLRRDRRVMGSYLRKPDNVFAQVQSASAAASTDLIRALQAAGAIRADVDPAVAAHLIDLLSYGYLVIEDFKPLDQFPPDETVLEGIAEMMDKMFTPEDGGDSAAGKAVIRQIVTAVVKQIEMNREKT